MISEVGCKVIIGNVGAHGSRSVKTVGRTAENKKDGWSHVSWTSGCLRAGVMVASQNMERKRVGERAKGVVTWGAWRGQKVSRVGGSEGPNAAGANGRGW